MPPEPPMQEELPEIEGVSFQYVPGQNGRLCVIATGRTQPKREILSGLGFRWSPERKIWWRYEDAS